MDQVNLGDGYNAIILRNQASIGTLDLTQGYNRVEFHSGSIGTIIAQPPEESVLRNTLELYGLSNRSLEYSQGGVGLNLMEGRDLDITLSAGVDRLKITQGSWVVVDCGTGDDYVEVAGGSDIFVNSTEGSNFLKITGGKNITLQSGWSRKASDHTELTGGEQIFVNGSNLGDSYAISGGTGLTINGWEGNDTFLVSGGDKVMLDPGSGDDYIEFKELQANCSYVVDELNSGGGDTDLINFSGYSFKDFDITRSGLWTTLAYKNGATVTIKNWSKDKGVQLQFADTEAFDWYDLFRNTPEASADSQLDIIKSFMASLANSNKSGYAALDEAVAFSSQGRFKNFNQLVEEFKQKIIVAQLKDTAEVMEFLQENCGMLLDNADTGSIVGSDCGGTEVRDKVSVVQEPEGASLADLTYDSSRHISAMYYPTPYYKTFSAYTNEGVTYYWLDSDLDALPVSREVCQQLIAGVVKLWGPAAFKLVEEATGLSLTQEDCFSYRLEDGTAALEIALVYKPNEAMASMSSYNAVGTMRHRLNINTYYYTKLMTDINGNPSTVNGLYMDRLLAHELTHAVCYGNINGMSDMPVFITEGLAELVHGIDDYRLGSLLEVPLNNLTASSNTGVWASNQKEALDLIFDLENPRTKVNFNMSYCGGYELLRYYAKQVMDYAIGLEDNPEAALSSVDLRQDNFCTTWDTVSLTLSQVECAKGTR